MQDQVETGARRGARHRGCSPLYPHVVDQLQAIARRRTDAAGMAQFGISDHSGRKLIAGHPIGSSLLQRLRDRVETLNGS